MKQVKVLQEEEDVDIIAFFFVCFVWLIKYFLLPG